MNNIEIVNENNNTKVSTQKITSFLIIFFAHIIKCISMSENRNKGWFSSIYNSSDAIRKIKKIQKSFIWKALMKYLLISIKILIEILLTFILD